MKYGPGKFEACGNYSKVARWLYNDDGTLDSISSVDELGWFACFEGKIKGRGPFYAIISEDSQGFVEVKWYEVSDSFKKAWAKIEKAYEEFEERCG